MRIRWIPTGPEEDEWARMAGHPVGSTDEFTAIYIMGVPMHVEAHAVHLEFHPQHGESLQTCDHEWGEQAIEPLYNGLIDSMDGPVRTFTHRNGREYVILIYPHCG